MIWFVIGVLSMALLFLWSALIVAARADAAAREIIEEHRDSDE